MNIFPKITTPRHALWVLLTGLSLFVPAAFVHVRLHPEALPAVLFLVPVAFTPFSVWIEIRDHLVSSKTPFAEHIRIVLLSPISHVHIGLRLILLGLSLWVAVGLACATQPFWSHIFLFLAGLTLVVWGKTGQTPVVAGGPLADRRSEVNVRSWKVSGLTRTLSWPMHHAVQTSPQISLPALKTQIHDWMEKHGAETCLLWWQGGQAWGVGERVFVKLTGQDPSDVRVPPQPLTTFAPQMAQLRLLSAMVEQTQHHTNQKDKNAKLWGHFHELFLTGLKTSTAWNHHASFPAVFHKRDMDLTAHEQIRARHTPTLPRDHNPFPTTPS